MRNYLVALALTVALPASADPPVPSPPVRTEQSILGPGLYVLQTRVLNATCGDADRTGFVSSYFAAIDGIPGAASMSMGLLNSTYWPRWSITVNGNTVAASATMQGGTGNSQFSVTRNGDRFTGTGARTYTRRTNGQAQTCQVNYEVLLRRIDR